MKLGRCENCETLREMLDAANTRYDRLMTNYHDLRVTGANATPTGLPIRTRELKPADQAIEDMVERYPHFVGLRKKLQRLVNIERQKPNADEEAIAALVREGQSGEVND